MRAIGYVPIVFCLCLAVDLGVARASELSLIPLIMALPFLGAAHFRRASERHIWALYGLWCFAWVMSVFAEIYVYQKYRLLLHSREVVEVILNAPAREALEYLSTAALPLLASLLSSAAVAAFMASHGLAVSRGLLDRHGKQRWVSLVAAACIIVPLAVHKNIVVERSDPVSFPTWIYAQGRKAEFTPESLRAQRKEANRHIDQWQPHYVGPPRKTVVLVLGESSDRWDWSLFGYSRRTNPKLEARRDQVLVFGDIISSYGNTLRSLTRALTFADIGDDESWRSEPTVPMLARAAGYKVFWLANAEQGSMYFQTVFGEEADVFKVVKGEHGDHFDGNLMPSLLEALNDPAPRKLIVLHTMGSHDDYAKRFPADFNVFGGAGDQVSRQMASQWKWVRDARDAYDNSVLYTDTFLSDLLDHLQARKEEDLCLFYLSDHGEEVGHLTSHTGHEFFLESGYVIPSIFWSNRKTFPTPQEKALEMRSYQTDKLEWTLLPLLSITTRQDQPSYDLFGPGYKPWTRLIDGRPYMPLVSHLDGRTITGQ